MSDAMSADRPDSVAPDGVVVNPNAELLTYSRRAKLHLDAPVLPSPSVQRPPRSPSTSSVPRRSQRLAAKSRKVALEGHRTHLLLARKLGVDVWDSRHRTYKQEYKEKKNEDCYLFVKGLKMVIYIAKSML